MSGEDLLDAGPSGQPGAASVLDDAPVALLVSDVDGTVVGSNPAWSALSGLAHDRSIGDGWLSALDDPDRHVLAAALHDSVRGIDVMVEVELDTVAGRRPTRWHLAPRAGGAGVVLAVVDLTDERARRAELEQRASHDALTGLFNRSEFLAFVGYALRRLDRHPGRLAVLFVDLDRFKIVNDHHGHLIGDEVLIAAAGRLRDVVRPEDVVARIGGDEFAVLCQDVTAEEPGQIARRVRSAFTSPLETAGGLWTVGASVGVATTDQPTTSPEGLVDAADRAMYGTKTGHPTSPPVNGARHRERPAALGAHASAEPAAGAGVSSEVADRLVRDLFAVGLVLTGCASSVDGPASGRLTSAVDSIDEIIRDVRIAVFQHRPRPPVTPADPGLGEPGDIEELVARLRRTAGHLDELARHGRADGPQTVELLDAVYASHGAARALEQAGPAVHAAQPRAPRAESR